MALAVKGMHYNPALYRWEGNENALAPFDAPLHPTHTRQISPLTRPALHSHSSNSNLSKLELPSQRPALITNINAASPTVQVVGGMVFDPQRMCWLKLSHHPSHHSKAHASQPLSDAGGEIHLGNDDEDSDDPFAGLEDLEDRPPSKDTTAPESGKAKAATTGAGGKPADEWLVGEEFDVGPEFVRRQRDEEERWRRKVSAWIGGGDARESEEWRWGIRDVVAGRL